MSKYRVIPAGFEDDEDEESLEDATSHLKISVIPDIRIGAALNGEDFPCDLGEEMDHWFDEYRDMWNAYKRTPAVQQKLKHVFMRHPDPLLLAMKLFANCPGCNNLKSKNLALFILETICEMHKQQPGIAAACDDNTRVVAFNFIKTCGVTTLYKAVMDAYELQKIRDLLVPKLHDLLAKGQYKDVAYWAMYLQITHLFGIFDLLFPLILQDKVFLAEEYLTVAEDQQLPCVQFLDSLLDKQKTVWDHCYDVIAKYKYVDIKQSVLSYRPMSKLVTRLAKKYKIAPEQTPHLNYSKACSYIHYLYHKYDGGGMSMDSWRELVRDAAKTEALQLDLVHKVASCGDLPEAVYWAKHFKVPRADCPASVQAELEKSPPLAATKSRETGVAAAPLPFDQPSNNRGGGGGRQQPACAPYGHAVHHDLFLTLQLPDDCILLVDGQRKFLEMLAYLEAQTIIAFDSEWKPSVCNDNVVSLMQLATLERVYLVDCLAPLLDANLWRQLGRRVFNNLEILKVGFSLHQDLRMLHKSLPLNLNLQASSCYLDLREMWRRLKYLQVIEFPHGKGTQNGESLTVLTELCLGKQLDKSNQCSNWANRPLRHDQIIYAALDAHCLLQIYQVLAELLAGVGLNMDEVVDEITTAKTGYLFRMKRGGLGANVEPNRGSRKEQRLGEDGSVKVTEIKFICDGMLQGLSKELRKLGADCVDVVGHLDVQHYIDLARREQRYVLTRDTRYTLFCSELPLAQCVQIPTDCSDEQILNVIQYFRIAVQARSLFTRCLQCNSNEFILALRDEVILMRYGDLNVPVSAGRGSDADSGPMAYVSPYDRTFQILHVNEHIMATKTTYRGKAIKLNRIKPHILRTKEYFFICDICGTCTWDGAHPLHSRIVALVETQAAAVLAASPSTDGHAAPTAYNNRNSGAGNKRATSGAR